MKDDDKPHLAVVTELKPNEEEELIHHMGLHLLHTIERGEMELIGDGQYLLLCLDDEGNLHIGTNLNDTPEINAFLDFCKNSVLLSYFHGEYGGD